MAIRKPRPKTQKEISIDRQRPSDPRYGNPNIPLPTNENETGIPFNRSEKLGLKKEFICFLAILFFPGFDNLFR